MPDNTQSSIISQSHVTVNLHDTESYQLSVEIIDVDTRCINMVFINSTAYHADCSAMKHAIVYLWKLELVGVWGVSDKN